jgi:hypothetical protein
LTNATRGVVVPDSPSALDFNHVIVAIQLPNEASAEGLWALQQVPKLGKVLFFGLVRGICG